MILNLTQHPATPEQNITDLVGEELSALKRALTFDTIPTAQEIANRAEYIAKLARSIVPITYGPFPKVMIGGAPYLMSALERSLLKVGLEPVYAFSTRESVEQNQPDGSVRKVNVFRHAGFVEVPRE